MTRHLASRLPLATGYFATASLAAGLTRFDGGVAFLWVANALLIADLMSRPRRHWFPSLLTCAIASFLATGLFGFGWALAGPFVVVNLVESVAAAWLFRRRGGGNQPLGSVSWLMQFLVAVALVGPAVGGVVAASVLTFAGHALWPTFFHFVVGHALGNLTVTPLALLKLRMRKPRSDTKRSRQRAIESGFLFTIMTVTTVVVFTLDTLPLLFLPILPIILVTFRRGRVGATTSLVLLALIGGGATLAGVGPMHLLDGDMGSRIQFFQFYLAATVLTVLPVTADLENRRRLHRAVRVSEQRYRVMAEHSSDVLLHLDRKARIRYASPSIERVMGHVPALIEGSDSNKLVHADHREQLIIDFHDIIAAQGETRTHQYLGATRDGGTRWFEMHSRAILDDDGEVDGVLAVVRDITKRKAAERQLTQEAQTDALTGLPNRRALRSAVLRSAGNGGTDCLAVLDIDHFKSVNDRFGHAAGDEVLRGFARVARRMIRDRDLVARIGGEEFAIYFPDTSVAEAMAICDALRTAVAESSLYTGTAVIKVTVSGGVALLGPQGMDHALANADVALYSAKRNGRDQLAIAA